MLHILTAEGYGDIARRLLTKPEYPSYRAMLDLGATTLWEHWPVQGLEGGYEVYDGSMSHPMHAAFDEWLYTGVAGLAARRSVREPWTFRWNDFPGLEHASAARRIPEGRISSEWRRDGRRNRLGNRSARRNRSTDRHSGLHPGNPRRRPSACDPGRNRTHPDSSRNARIRPATALSRLG